MSRIGKRPIPVADGVQVQYTDREFSVKGPKGEMKMRIHDDVELNTEEGVIQLAPNASKGITPMLGTTWALVRNMLVGVSTGFVKELNLVGVGYRASTSSNMLEMNLGYSHPIKYEIPKG
ncbi:MAG: 50S ribosomal protein L6, partial [bacterium]